MNKKRREESPLEIWHRSIQYKRIEEYSTEDICKCIRQKIDLEKLLPIAIEKLINNPSAGELYEGELLTAINNIVGLRKYITNEKIDLLNTVFKEEMIKGDEEINREIESYFYNLEHEN